MPDSPTEIVKILHDYGPWAIVTVLGWVVFALYKKIESIQKSKEDTIASKNDQILSIVEKNIAMQYGTIEKVNAAMDVMKDLLLDLKEELRALARKK